MFGTNRVLVSDLKCQIEDLNKEVSNLKYANEAYKKRLETEMANASFAIDWDAMKVFSVERVWDNGLPKTVLGWMISEPVITTEGDDQKITTKDVVREWCLYCSAEKHEQLVAEFVQWKKKK